MTTTALRLSSIHKKTQTKLETLEMPKINWKLIFIACVFVFLALWVLYTFSINGLTRGAFTIKSYEKQISELMQENRKLEVTFAENNFLGQVQQKTQDLNFEKVTQIKYVELPNNSLALKK